MILPNDTKVTSVPARLMSAEPIGIRYSSVGTAPLSPYINSDSIKMTGSLSRMEVFNSPLASYGLDGTTTFSPGVLANQFSKFCECCELSIPAFPVGPRNTIGTLNCPPDIDIILAAPLMIWSMATREKLNVINSTMGRMPFMAAPTPIPVKPNSEMGVSITRSGPNSSSMPWLTL